MFKYTEIENLNVSSTNDSRVVRIKDDNTHENFVMKLIWSLDNTLSATMFNREISSLYKLNDYPMIVKIVTHETGDFCGHTNCGAIILEYIDGKNLEQLDTYSLNPLLKYHICHQIIEAIQCAHNSGILHRDIKPSNIMFSNTSNTVKVIDFGISKIKSEIDSATMQGHFSLNYSAPEVVQGKISTEKSDIYSVGAVIYKLLLNEPPDNPSNIFENISKSVYSDEIKDLLTNMLQENPDQRLSDLDEALTVFNRTITDVQSKSYSICFQVPTTLFENLKRSNAIEMDCVYSKFLNLVLPAEFKKSYALYDDKNGTYTFIGRHFIMECVVTSNDVLRIDDLHTLPPETIHRLKSKFKDVDMQIKFLSPLQNTTCSSGLHNLKVLLVNHNKDMKSDRAIKEKFDMLFSKWRAYLNDCIESKKSQNPYLTFKNHEFRGRELVFDIEEYSGRNIDELDDSVEFAIGTYKHGGRTFSVRSTFARTEIDNDSTRIVTVLGNDMPLQRAKDILKDYPKDNNKIVEDCRESISVYTKQLAAITKLERNDYRMKGLKELLLLIQPPSTSLSYDDLEFINEKLDVFQKEAVKKALFSDSICLIQGPPGTGKTSVIKETISQILSLPRSKKIPPKILIVSQSNPAVDNIIEDLRYDDIRVLRIGNIIKFSPKVADKFSLDSYRSKLFSSIEEDSTQFINDKLAAMGLFQGEIEDLQISSDTEKWTKICNLHKEWLERKDIDALGYHILSSSNIVAGTCTGYLSNDYIRDLTFDYVIVDEAAKASTPELVLAILNAKKIIFVGDHYQLPPFSDSNLSPLANELSQNDKYKLFNLLYENLQGENKQLLSIQYRMTPNIGNLISHVFYDDSLSSGSNAKLLEHGIKTYDKYSIIWHDTSKLADHGQTPTREGGSFANSAERRIIIRLLKEISQNNANLDVGIITGYSYQKQMLERAVESQNLRRNFKQLKVDTVDSFQGRENDIIIFSTVRTRDSIGFQKFKERVNVAFSRAKKLLIICGDLKFMANYDDINNKFMLIEDYIRNSSESKIIQEV